MNNKSNKIDYKNLNSVISLFDKFLKLVFIAVTLYLLTYINKEWKILSIIGTFLSVMIPFFIGVLIAWLFDPFVSWLQKKGVRRILGTMFSYLIFIAVLVLIFSFAIPTLYDQINLIINRAPDLISNFSADFDRVLLDLAKNYDLNFLQLQGKVYSAITDVWSSITIDIPSLIIGLVRTIFSGGFKFVFGLFIGFYLLLDFDGFKAYFDNLLPKKPRNKYRGLFKELDTTLKNYVLGTLFVVSILFVCQTVGFTIAGLEAPLVFGLICAITNVIPYVGPYIGGIPAVIVGFTISPQVGIFTLIAVVICQLLENNLLTPMVMSKTMKLHPVVIIVGLLVFGHFFGIVGMLFATPIISALKIISLFFIKDYREIKAK